MIQILCTAPLFFLPLFVQMDFVLTIFIFSFLLAIAAIGLNLNFGFTGQLNMFQAASFGMSAYITFLSTQKLGVSFWTGLALAAVVVTVVSLIVGFLSLRFGLRAFYFALVTLAFSELVRLVAVNWTDMTRGTLGLLILDNISLSLPGLPVLQIEGPIAWYYVSLTIMVAALVVSWLLVRSWIGRCFAAIRLNEDLAETLGINVFRYKLLSFVIADLFAVIAGAFYAYYTAYIDPDYISITQSLNSLTTVLLGGLGTLIGPVVGALILGGLPNLISAGAIVRAMLLGGIIIVVILGMPRGIVGGIIHLFRKAQPDAA